MIDGAETVPGTRVVVSGPGSLWEGRTGRVISPICAHGERPFLVALKGLTGRADQYYTGDWASWFGPEELESVVW